MGRTREDFPLQEYYSEIHTTYDRVNRIFTFGRDRNWRKIAARCCLRHDPLRIADICAGTGDFVLELAGSVDEKVELTAFDFNREMLEQAKRKHREISNAGVVAPVRFIEGDVASMPFEEGAFDAIGITFGIRNLVYENSNAGLHLSELARVLRKGGHLVLLESCRPGNVVWRFFHNLYLRFILPSLGGLISGHPEAYRYLARSSRNYYTIGEMGSILEGAGFRIHSARALFMGSVMLVDAEKE